MNTFGARYSLFGVQNNDNLARDDPVETIVEIGEGNLDESRSSLNEVSQEETMVQIEPEKVDLRVVVRENRAKC